MPKKHVVGAVLPKSSAASAAIELEAAGLTRPEAFPPLESVDDLSPAYAERIPGPVDVGPHEVLVVIDITEGPEQAEHILIRHGGRLVTPPHRQGG